jgi:acylphosphatase
MNAAAEIIVHGRVQGVGFRYSARAKALDLGVCGWVKNRPDGTVEAYAEGSSEAVALFTAWLKKGPPGSRVSAAAITSRPFTGKFKSFDITC